MKAVTRSTQYDMRLLHSSRSIRYWIVDCMPKTAGKEQAQEPLLLSAVGAPLRQTTGDPFLPV